MDTITHAYEVFGDLMTNWAPKAWPAKTFPGLCRYLDVPEEELNAVILEETGRSGAEIMSRCCKSARYY